MKMKTLQILLLLAAVVCAVGIFLGLSGGSHMDENNFQPPGWLKGLSGLAGGPRLSARDLTANGRSLQEPLVLSGGTTRQFDVSSSEDEVRRVTFLVTRQGNETLYIRYEPRFGQRLNDQSVSSQRWPNEDNGEPSFVVYDRGGTFVFFNAGPGPVKIRVED